MSKLERLADKVTILKLSAHPRRKKLFRPVVVEGRQFSEEMVHAFEPYHRRLAAKIDEADGVTTVTIKLLRDVSTEMRIEHGSRQLRILSIGQYEQGFDADGKHVKALFTVLKCEPAEAAT